MGSGYGFDEPLSSTRGGRITNKHNLLTRHGGAKNSATLSLKQYWRTVCWPISHFDGAFYQLKRNWWPVFVSSHPNDPEVIVECF